VTFRSFASCGGRGLPADEADLRALGAAEVVDCREDVAAAVRHRRRRPRRRRGDGHDLVAASDPLLIERLGELARAGAIAPRIERVYPLERVTDGFLHIASAKARGKLGVAVDPDSEVASVPAA
jgi:Zinc-binding dehydrogenase